MIHVHAAVYLQHIQNDHISRVQLSNVKEAQAINL